MAEKAEQSSGTAFLYFQHSNRRCQSAINVAKSLLRQLFERYAGIHPHLLTFYKTFGVQKKHPGLKDVIDCLKSVAKSFSSAYVILDALDECEISQRRKILKMIKQLNSVSVRVLATSRPHLQDVQKFFENTPQIIVEADTEDLKRYLIKTVSERIPEYGTLKDDIVNILSVKSNGLYVSQISDPIPILTIKQIPAVHSAAELCPPI